MNQRLRLKLDMALRVRDNVRARPDAASPGFTAASAALEQCVEQAEALARQFVSGRMAVSGAVETRIRLRREIGGTLTLLAGLGHRVAETDAELGRSLTRGTSGMSNADFLVAGRVTAASIAGHAELLQRVGMPEKLPEDLSAALDRFEAALNEKHSGQASHIGARAQLDAVMAEIMALVRQLDALNEFRFRGDAEALGAWRSARNVAWPAGKHPSTDGKSA